MQCVSNLSTQRCISTQQENYIFTPKTTVFAPCLSHDLGPQRAPRVTCRWRCGLHIWTSCWPYKWKAVVFPAAVTVSWVTRLSLCEDLEGGRRRAGRTGGPARRERLGVKLTTLAIWLPLITFKIKLIFLKNYLYSFFPPKVVARFNLLSFRLVINQ